MNTIRRRLKGYTGFPFESLKDKDTGWRPWHIYKVFLPKIFQRKKDAVDYYGSSIPVFKVEIILSRNSKEFPEMKVIK